MKQILIAAVAAILAASAYAQGSNMLHVKRVALKRNLEGPCLVLRNNLEKEGVTLKSPNLSTAQIVCMTIASNWSAKDTPYRAEYDVRSDEELEKYNAVLQNLLNEVKLSNAEYRRKEMQLPLP